MIVKKPIDFEGLGQNGRQIRNLRQKIYWNQCPKRRSIEFRRFDAYFMLWNGTFGHYGHLVMAIWRVVELWRVVAPRR